MNARRVTEFRVGDLYSKQMGNRNKWLMVVRVMAAQGVVFVIVYDFCLMSAPHYETYEKKQLGRALKTWKKMPFSEMPSEFPLWVNNHRANGCRRPAVIDTAEKAIAALWGDAEVLGD